MPLDFPPHLKDFILCGWSKEPKNRPPLAECMAALNKMLNRDDKEIDNEATDRDNSLMLPGKNLSNEKEEMDSPQEMGDSVEFQKEGNLNEIGTFSQEELCINSETGKPSFGPLLC